MDIFSIKERSGRFEVYAQVNLLGGDILVVIAGGKEHIGAIGIGQPRPSLKDPDKISSTGSVYTFLGHKEDVLAKALSENLSKRLNKKTVVVAGIHWDNLKEEEIDEILDICKKIEDRIIEVMERI
ncbi:MAG TPA: hypothetical protein PKW07_08905 [Syntrophorhabdaceae bacterium]|nr:hypothetical protein [Syntrophorhabdaceae bacterium]